MDDQWFDVEALHIPADCYLVADLGKPLPLDERYDLAVSLEVGEHLEASLAGGLVDSLTRLAPVVLFSAAIPGQSGTHHGLLLPLVHLQQYDVVRSRPLVLLRKQVLGPVRARLQASGRLGAISRLLPARL